MKRMIANGVPLLCGKTQQHEAAIEPDHWLGGLEIRAEWE